MRHAACILLITLFSLAGRVSVAGAAEGAPGEYDIKAALLYNFSPFVQWPAADRTKETFVLGIVGKNPFGNTLKAIEGRMVGDRRLVIKTLDSNAEGEALKACQVLYLAVSDKEKRKRILRVLSGTAVLTVGESRDFAEQGGMIGFVKKRDRIAFEINCTAAEKAGLTIRSQLLRLAERVFTKDAEGTGGAL